MPVPSTLANTVSVGWQAESYQRLKSDWLLKQIGTFIGMTAFFVVYFFILKHPIKPVTIMPLTAVDHWIRFEPAALGFYVSLWLYIPLLPALIKQRSALLRYTCGAFVLSVLGLCIFALAPTAVPVAGMDLMASPAMQALKTLDASGNACPSLHVAFAVYNLFGFECLFRCLRFPKGLRAVNMVWALGIIYSTLAVKQHVFLDVLAGVFLGAICAYVTFAHWYRGNVDL